MTAVTSAWNRLLAFVGRFSMYRLVLIALALLTVISLLLSLFDALLGESMETLLADLPVSAEIKAALLERSAIGGRQGVAVLPENANGATARRHRETPA